MNISLNPHFRKFVKETLKGGRFKSASEVVREGLRLLEEREARLIALRRDIAEGRESGEPRAYDPAAIKRRGQTLLKRVFLGPLVPVPAELTPGLVPVDEPLPAPVHDSPRFRIIYAVARL